MTDFAFKIEGDAANANREADTVLDRLAKIDAAAKKASQGMSFDKLTQSFARLAQAMQAEQSALQRTTQLHQQLTAANAPLTQSFAGLARALQNEQDMLERIHGPMKQYQADVQALDGLLKRGAITQQQYTAQRAQLGTQPAKGGGALDALGSLRGAAGAVGIGIGVSQIGELTDTFQNLQNRLRYLAGGDMAKVNSLFTDLQGVAARTRGDLSATTEAFVRMSLATKQMGLSTSDTMRLTESLNKAVALSGATGAEAAAGMIQLSQGLASGALRGDELRSVMEQLPAVADVIASGLGVTRGELRKMGEDGKITAQVIVDAFRKAGPQLDKDFGNTVPTLSQSFTAFKNELIVTFGQVDKSLGLSNTFGSVLRGIGDVVKTLLIPVQLLGAAFDALGSAGGVAAAGIAGAVVAGPVGAIVGVTVALGAQAGAFDDVSSMATRLMEIEDEYARRRGGYVYALMQGAEALNKWHKEQTEFNLRLTLGADAADAFARALQGLTSAEAAWANASAKAYQGLTGQLNELAEVGLRDILTIWGKLDDVAKKHAANVKKATDAYYDYNRALLSVDFDRINRALTGDKFGKGIQGGADELAKTLGELKKQFDDLAKQQWKDIDAQADAIINAQADAVLEANGRLLKAHDEQIKAAKEVQKAWAEGLGSIAADFVNMAAQGEMSFDKITSSLAKLALQIAAMQIGGPWGAALGSFVGGLNLPGHATGTQFYVGGQGGTDQNIVAFRATNNERVTVETPEDRRTGKYFGGGMRGASVPAVYNVFQNDPREVVSGMGTRAGQTQFVKLNRKFNQRR